MFSTVLLAIMVAIANIFSIWFLDIRIYQFAFSHCRNYHLCLQWIWVGHQYIKQLIGSVGLIGELYMQSEGVVCR